MRLAFLFLALLGACRPSPPNPPAVAARSEVRGRVFAGDAALVGARVRGSAGVRRGKTDEEFDLGAVTSGPDGSFAFPLPERFARAMADRTTWTWWVRIEGDHDELLVCRGVHADEPGELADVRLQFVRVDPDVAKDVRDRIESLRNSPLKKHFRYGTDPVDGYGEAQEDFAAVEEAASYSRSAREVVRKYLKDDDPALQALAYEVLTLSDDSPDVPPRPPNPGTPAQARALLDWAFATIRNSRHGGHLALGVDLDDICPRCNSLWSAVDLSLWYLTRQEAREALQKYEKEDGQIRVLRTLALDELRRTRTRDDREKEPDLTPDAPLAARPDLSGEWIAVRRFPGILLSPPQADASPVALLPPWLGLQEVAWSPDGKRFVGRGGPSAFSQFELWLVDLERGHASRATWGSHDWRPQWFPDGKRILFPRNAGKGQDLWVVELEGFKASRLREIGQWVDDFDLDPSGTKLAYATRDDTGPTGLHVLDLRTGRVQTVSPGRVTHPVWSPDGKRVAFVRNGLFLADVPGGPVWEIGLKAENVVGLARAADGRMAVTTYEGPFNRARDGRLWVLKADGSEPRVIAKMKEPVPHFDRPDWSPDGKRIAFVALEGPKENPVLYVASDDGETLIRVLEGAEHPRWRPWKQ